MTSPAPPSSKRASSAGVPPKAVPPLDTAQARRLQRYLLLANLLDQAFRVPGTKWRFGLDGLFGLIPGAGDIATALMGGYGVFTAYQLGAPASIQLRMLLNLTVDAAVGTIPVLGDLFDFAFKAHVRNSRLLEDWLAQPKRTRRSSAFVMLAVLVTLLAVVVGTVWLAVILAIALYRLVGGTGA
jgi:hypothetical protein